MTPSRLQAGMAEVEITPPVGTTLVGELNVRAATGIGTPLLARALALSDGERRVAIVTLDLAGLPRESFDHLSAGATSRGLAPEALLLVCSHTRGGPASAPLIGAPDADPAYLSSVEAATLAAIERALREMRPAALGAGHATLPHLVYNHRLLTRNYRALSAWLDVPPDEVLEPEGPSDPALSVLLVRDERGFPRCVVWSMAADIRFARDALISADLPGLVQQEVDRRAGGHLPCLYLPGCGGDVSYSHSLEKTIDLVASAIMAVQLETPCDPQVRLGAAHESMVLPIRDYTEFRSRPDVQLKWLAAVEAFAHEVELLQAAAMQAVPAQVGGYETWPSRGALVGPGGGEFVAEQAARLLERLWRR
jgi:hypothetical protein